MPTAVNHRLLKDRVPARVNGAVVSQAMHALADDLVTVEFWIRGGLPTTAPLAD